VVLEKNLFKVKGLWMEGWTDRQWTGSDHYSSLEQKNIIFMLYIYVQIISA